MRDAVGVATFEDFVRATESRLREALSAALGSDLGREATAEALAYAWEHWDRVGAMENPAGYLYVLGRGRGRRMRRRRVVLMPVAVERTPWVEPGLPAALANLPEQQRIVVMLLYCFEWTMSEVAELLDISKSTVQSHAERGLGTLRAGLGVSS
jgi:DNA-directed RNA polymerase specialized sigma24 family protein